MPLIEYENSMLFSSDPSLGAINRSSDGSSFEVQFGEPLSIPKNAVNCSVSVFESTIWYTVPNLTVSNNRLYIYGDSNTLPSVPTLYSVIIPKGLYDLGALSSAVLSQLSDLGARISPLPLISFYADSNTQKVVIKFNYSNVYIDFTQTNTFREIIGFLPLIYGPYTNSPLSIIASNVASFNQINYFLISSNIVSQGIRINNKFNNILSQVLITVSPGSQQVSAPFNPAKIQCNELVGSSRTNLKFSLTDDKLRAVDTNGEYFTLRLVIKYYVNSDL